MSEQEVQWGEWEDLVPSGGAVRWGPNGELQYADELDASYLNALEREVRDLRAYKVLADEAASQFEFTLRGALEQWQRDWLARYDSLPSTSEGEGK